MSSVNSCAVTSPLHGNVGRQGCHALIAVQYLLLSTGLCGGKDSIHSSFAVSSPFKALEIVPTNGKVSPSASQSGRRVIQNGLYC